MSKHYGTIAFTDSVRKAQAGHGSRAFYDRQRSRVHGLPGQDPLTDAEREFRRNGMASIWPRSANPAGPTSSTLVVRSASCT